MTIYILYVTHTEISTKSSVLDGFDAALYMKNPSAAVNVGIVGGDDAIMGEFPYQASLQRRNEDGTYGHVCGATIINEQWAVTAAHCCQTFFGEEPEMHVKVGGIKLEQTQQEVNVADRTIHNKYNDTSSENDICMLKVNLYQM